MGLGLDMLEWLCEVCSRVLRRVRVGVRIRVRVRVS